MKPNVFFCPLAMAGLCLALTACRSEPPHLASTRGGSTTTAPVVVAEWRDADFEATFEQNRYGDPQRSLLLRDSPHVVFSPRTAQDHVATPFVSLHGGLSSVALVLQANSTEGDACVATLQDQGFKVLGTLPCAGTGERKTTIKTSGNVTQVRVYFQSPNAEPQQLPAQIQIVIPVS